MKNGLTLLLLVATVCTLAAQKKSLDHPDFAIWKTIEKPKLSPDGRWAAYVLQPGEGDPRLVVYDAWEDRSREFERADDAAVSADSRFVVFRIHPHQDTLQAQRRRKVKKDDLPKDTLGIYDLSSGLLEKIPHVQSFQLPEKWSGRLAYHLEPAPRDTTRADTVRAEEQDPPKLKKENKENGTRLVLRDLNTGSEDTVGYVVGYVHAEEGARWLLQSTGDDSTFLAGVYRYDSSGLSPLFRQKGKYGQLTLSKDGARAAFVADLDTTDARIRPYALYHWSEELDTARLAAGVEAGFLPAGWLISQHGKLIFSKDGSKLFFGVAPPPILQDTSLLEEEIVNVEVWAYTDTRLYTQQEVQLEQDKKRSYRSVFHTGPGRSVQLGSEAVPEVETGNEGNAPVALGYNAEPYRREISWAGYPECKDLYLIDVETGERKLLAERVCGNPAFSPGARYVYWYSSPDTAWFAYSVEEESLRQITDNREVPFFDERNDVPDHPSPYGIAGWLENDRAVWIYDRYDIWEVDPTGKAQPRNLTGLREVELTARYVRLDPDARFIEADDRRLLEVFDHNDKVDGFIWMDPQGQLGRTIRYGDYRLGRPQRARQAERYLFTIENFEVFPDLHYAADLRDPRRISRANPQQDEYAWGTAELYGWTSLEGEPLQGILYKPADFNPDLKYPMIVYFYERNADNLHRHWHPYPLRSIINFSFYVSRGYLVFVPDIPYQIGYPGQSAYRDRIGVQGHSWGGYQVAHLITQTDIFRCAESGAPVVNMISAYGGIRWESGLSRMFQYERTQSRIGGTLWEYPLRYLENSPIFHIDKVRTPVLILHNDEDGAVPWYQGIEFFTALRRLGKPAWMLNYNGEPHWPVKLQNRKDFQRRMQQFFDHYLLDAPRPQWMERGVPAIEKGIEQGFEDGKQDK